MKKYKNEMGLSLLTVTAGIWTKVLSVLSTCWGWILTTATAILAYFVGIKYMFLIISILVLLDFLFGIIASLKQKKPILSDKMRNTITKFGVYIVIIPAVYAIESTVGLGGLVHKIIFGVASSVELYSIIANMLIIAPNIPILKFFKFIVSGEITKKLEDYGIDKEKVNQILDENNKSN
jgi:hypothetical protein